ncbi:hypothetical protein K488DRAFT_79531 [Vararia minispora EC-137]|uniref:Uncharacterized protein n=1 Tax=Vararia minispora EC-137 TaxID=1314806 RepID=A0ACB8QFR6_9AGAM|nr:hypothetical protein K488DRAFT_79531 [Vararia minispora EC-137]
MAENTPERAWIRNYAAGDEKEVRFMLGQSQMENLAFANNRLYFHPVTMAIWLATSAAFAQWMGWLPPKPEHGLFGYVSLLPAVFSCAVPMMFFIDWCNRSSVEARTENTLRRPDMLDIPTYYARSPASGFFILQWGDKIIGLAAVDASYNSTNDTPLTKGVKLDAQQTKDLLTGKGTSKVVTIRHFFSEEGYRSAGIEEDLIQNAIRKAFSDAKVQTIRVSVSPLKRTFIKCLRKSHFVEGESDGKLGPFGWEWRWYTLDREKWEAAAAR